MPRLAIFGRLDEHVPFGGGVGVSGTDFASQLDTLAPLLALDGGHARPGSAGSPLDPTEPVHAATPATPRRIDFLEPQFE